MKAKKNIGFHRWRDSTVHLVQTEQKSSSNLFKTTTQANKQIEEVFQLRVNTSVYGSVPWNFWRDNGRQICLQDGIRA